MMTIRARCEIVSASSCSTGTSWVSPCGLACSSTSKTAIRCDGIAPRRDVADDPAGDAGQPDRVTLLERQVPERPGDPPGVLDLGHARRAEAHRAAGVEHQAAAQVGVGLELLDEEPVRPAVGPPVQPPQVVARHVLAILGELDARAAVRAGMPPRDAPLHRPPREQRKARQSRQDGRIQKASRLAVGNIRSG